jgi:hypothetical protein
MPIYLSIYLPTHPSVDLTPSLFFYFYLSLLEVLSNLGMTAPDFLSLLLWSVLLLILIFGLSLRSALCPSLSLLLCLCLCFCLCLCHFSLFMLCHMIVLDESSRVVSRLFHFWRRTTLASSCTVWIPKMHTALIFFFWPSRQTLPTCARK